MSVWRGKGLHTIVYMGKGGGLKTGENQMFGDLYRNGVHARQHTCVCNLLH